MKITVLGSGSFGIALSILLNTNRHKVNMWTLSQETHDSLIKERCNKKLLPNIIIPDSICITRDIDCASDCDVIVLAIPSFAIESILLKLINIINDSIIIVNVGKGLDKNNDFCRFSQTISRIFPKNPCVVLTGPTHAEEVARSVPTTILAASHDIKTAQVCQDVFMNQNFRVYTTNDIIGAELGGALKNIIALAAGICDGLGLGDNTKAGLMTRGLTEIARLGIKLGAQNQTFAGLSGIGDLIVTCTSMHSRNRRAGILIGNGTVAAEAINAVGGVVEGYYATDAAFNLSNKLNVQMPITQAMYKVLYENYDVITAIQELMAREKKHESETIWMSE